MSRFVAGGSVYSVSVGDSGPAPSGRGFHDEASDQIDQPRFAKPRTLRISPPAQTKTFVVQQLWNPKHLSKKTTRYRTRTGVLDTYQELRSLTNCTGENVPLRLCRCLPGPFLHDRFLATAGRHRWRCAALGRSRIGTIVPWCCSRSRVGPSGGQSNTQGKCRGSMSRWSKTGFRGLKVAG